MQNIKHFIFFILFALSQVISAQTTSKTDTIYNFEIDYSSPKQYTIAGIDVTGADNYEDFMLINFSGLEIGKNVSIPGDEISNSVKKFWQQSLFSEVKIFPEKALDDKIWLVIQLKARPKVSEINYNGVKKSEKEDIDKRIGLIKDKQITPSMSDRAKTIIKKYLDEKGFSNADVKVLQRDDPAKKGNVIVDIEIDKKLKTKVNKVYITGNKALSNEQIDRAMKKTNDASIWNLLRTRKYIRAEYEKDKTAIIEKYNEIGYRDAYITSDSIVPFDDKSVNVHITVDEGKKYYFRNLNWVGNTLYPREYLSTILNIKKGDIYNHKLLTERLETDENDAVSKLYRDRGYLFFQIDPVETAIDGDSIDFEIRMFEGKAATVNEVNIIGNDRVYEHVIRRELRTKPGELFSQENWIRSIRELSQMGHFDPEQLQKDASAGIKPNQENGTVDIDYKLTTKSSDQVQLSAGWGAAGLVGSLGFTFSNFAIQNLFNGEMYRVVPQGEGQTFSINAQTNGKYYTSASLSFLEPWLGGKRPNSLSVSLYYTSTSDMSDRYYNTMSNYGSNYGYGSYGYGGYSGYGNYGSSNYGYGYGYDYGTEVDKTKYMRTIGLNVSYGKRLSWPDDYFSLSTGLAFQRYMLSNWSRVEIGLPFSTGISNDVNLNLTLMRSSIDNPLFTRKGSTFTLGLEITPPYSLFSNKDYSTLAMQDRFKWLEYHKWKFSAKNFTSLLPSINKTPVLMTRAEFAYIGDYNKYARTPFGTYMVGGDGMSGYSGYTREYVSLRGYQTGGLSSYYNPSYVYSKFSMELRMPISLEQSATIWGLAFLEAGNAYNSIKDFNPFELKRSAGVGVRIVLPMFGLMGIDWGYGFDKQIDEMNDATKKRHGGEFHFVMGRDL